MSLRHEEILNIYRSGCVSERELHSSVLPAVSSSYKTRSDNQQSSHLLLDYPSIRLLNYPLCNHAFQPTHRMLWQPPQLWTQLAQLIVLSTDVRLVRKATAVAMLQVLWRMVQLRHQRFLPNVPRLAMRQLPLLHGIDVSLIWLLYPPMPQLRMINNLTDRQL